MKILIKVTKEALERSKMCGQTMQTSYAPVNCAIALSVRDIFPKAVINKGRCMFFGDFNQSVILPQIAKEFISEFDESMPDERVLMQPFSFEIEVPEYVISKIGISAIYKTLSESSTLSLVMDEKEEF